MQPLKQNFNAPKTCQKPLGKNLLKIPQPKIQQKSCTEDCRTKNLLW
jgi:hypothetical protein